MGPIWRGLEVSQMSQQGGNIPYEQSLDWENSQNGIKNKRESQVSGLAFMRAFESQKTHSEVTFTHPASIQYALQLF